MPEGFGTDGLSVSDAFGGRTEKTGADDLLGRGDRGSPSGKDSAYMRGSRYPVLQDLRDAAVTCIGHGNFAEISISLASVEIGTKDWGLARGGKPYLHSG